jgi:hypothetical protein
MLLRRMCTCPGPISPPRPTLIISLLALVFPGVTRGWLGPLERPATAEEMAQQLPGIEGTSHFIRSRGTLDDLVEIRNPYEAALNRG